MTALALLLVAGGLSASAWSSLALRPAPDDGALVFTLDGQRVLDGASDLPLAPGDHHWELRRAGYQSQAGTLRLAPGERRVLPVTLAPLFPGAGAYFTQLPWPLQQAGRWWALEPLGLGLGLIAGAPQAHVSLLRLSVWSPLPWWPLRLSLAPLAVTFEPRTDAARAEAISSTLGLGLAWAGGHLLAAAGAHLGLTVAGQRARGGLGLDAELGLPLSAEWALVGRYDLELLPERRHALSLAAARLFH